MTPKPHVSQAIKGLRRWVVLSAMAVAVAALVQALVFGFVNYTDVRYTTVEAAPPTELKIVESPGPRVVGLGQGVTAAPRSLQGPGQTIEADAPATGASRSSGFVAGVRGVGDQPVAAVDVNRVLSVYDGYLRRASTIATVIGSIAALTLAMMVFMGTVVAGGGAVPGVERAVTASFWSIVLGLLCLPIRDIMPSMPIPGVFSGYDGLVAASESVAAGGQGWSTMMAKWLVMPIAAALSATLVATWFCSGVRRGVIVTSVSELDRQVEREVAEIAKRGVNASTPRTLAALNRAIGDVEESAVDALERTSSVASSLVRETRTPLVNHAEYDTPRAGAHPGRLI